MNYFKMDFYHLKIPPTVNGMQVYMYSNIRMDTHTEEIISLTSDIFRSIGLNVRPL